MAKINRNAQCPCGSGRKYKHCCLAIAEKTDFQYRRLRQIESNLIQMLLLYAEESLGPEALAEAWEEFNDYQPVEPLDPDSPVNMLFKPWFIWNWIYEREESESSLVETTVAESFLADFEDELTPDEKAYISASFRRPFSLCEVVETIPGQGMALFDLLRRVEFNVTEHMASSTLQRGQIIYCASTELFAVSFNVATGPYPLDPTAKRDVLELREWMVKELESDEITSENLADFEFDIRGLYLEFVQHMFTPPRLANTDGEPWVPHELHFEIESANEAFHALKDLAKDSTESDLITSSNGGVIESAEIPWHGGNEKAKKRMGGSVLLGLLKIEGRSLVAEVNSTNRAAEIRLLIEKRLGKCVTYKTILIEPIESEIEKMWEAAISEANDDFKLPQPPRARSSRKKAKSKSDDLLTGSDIPLEALPEVAAMLKEVFEQQWQVWVEEPVPALNNMTPREAAKTPEGRGLLESLLLHFEQGNSSDPDDPSNVDIPKLRRELGLI